MQIVKTLKEFADARDILESVAQRLGVELRSVVAGYEDEIAMEMPLGCCEMIEEALGRSVCDPINYSAATARRIVR